MIETYANNHAAQRFELTIDGRLVAWLDYDLTDDIVALNHTEVSPTYRGCGLAGDLVSFALAHAQLRDLRVKPHCSYVASFIERHREYAGLVA